MSVKLFAFLTILSLSICIRTQGLSSEISEDYKSYLEAQGKHYSNPAEYQMRLALYADSVKRVKEVNESGTTYKAGLNKFSDMTPEEQKKYRGKLVRPETVIPPPHNQDGQSRRLEEVDPFEGLPRSVNWNDQGIITSVKDQGSCGSCTMFATGALVESWLKTQGTDADVSEQQLVDCTYYFYNNLGCNGGWNYNNMDYLVSHKLRTESSYRYKERTQVCRTALFGKYQVNDYGFVPTYSMRNLIDQLSRSPVAIGLYASDAFLSYSSGVFDHTTCSDSDIPNHAVLAYGYDLDATPPYLMLKNSWGTSWGEAGHFKLSFDYVDASNGPCNMLVDNDNVYII